MRFRLSIACGAIAPIVIAATQPVRLSPSSSWVLDYAENSCRLLRKFGDGKTQVMLQIESDAPGDTDMLAIGKPLESNDENVAARFLPVGGKTFEGKVARTTTDQDPAILWSRVYLQSDQIIEEEQREAAARAARAKVRPPPIDLETRARRRLQRQQFAQAANELEIQTRRNRPVVLETGSMGDPIKMFDKCARESLKDWGVDPNLEDKIVRPAWAPAQYRWFSSNDYPPDMAKRREESVVQVRLLVDATGKVTKCTSLSDFKEAEFNQITCAVIMRRAHFEPAELADGTKVPSYYTQRVVFRMGR